MTVAPLLKRDYVSETSSFSRDFATVIVTVDPDFSFVSAAGSVEITVHSVESSVYFVATSTANPASFKAAVASSWDLPVTSGTT